MKGSTAMRPPLTALLILAFLLPGPRVRSEEPAPKKEERPAKEKKKRDETEYLRPSLTMNEDVMASLDIERAGQLAASNRLAQAVKLLQSVSDRFEGKTIRQGNLYLSVEDVVRARIAALGEQGIRVYRLLYDPLAGKRLVQAEANHDEAALREVAWRYYWSIHAARALGLLADWSIEKGRFVDALAWLQQLRDYPDTGLDPADIAARQIYCLVRTGLPAEAQRLVDELSVRRITRGSVKGRRVVLRDYLAELLKEWGMGGQARRGGAAWSAGSASHAQPMPDCDLAESISIAVPAVSFMASPARGWKYGMPISIPIPTYSLAWDARTMVAGVGNGLWALDAVTGEVLWDERAAPKLPPIPGPEAWDELMPLDSWVKGGAFCFAAPCLAEGRVCHVEPTYPSQPERARGLIDVQAAMAMLSNAVVCRDVRTGRVLWRLGRTLELGPRPAVPVRFLASPVYWHGRLFLPALIDREVCLVCVDSVTGKIVFRTVLATVPEWTGERVDDVIFEVMTLAAPPVAIGDRQAIVSTGCGVIFVCSAVTGRIEWAYGYSRSRQELEEETPLLSFPGFLFGLGMIPAAPIVSKGRVFLAPSDGEEIFALDLKSRERLWTVARGGTLRIAGLAGDRLVLQGETVRAVSAGTGDKLWTLAQGPALVGACAVTGKRVYAPTEAGVLAIDLATGKAGGEIAWGEGFSYATGANVFSLPDRLVMISGPNLCMRIDTSSALAEAGRLAKSAPTAWRAHLLRGRVYAVRNDRAAAEREFLQAVALAGKGKDAQTAREALFGYYVRAARQQRDTALLDKARALMPDDADRLATLGLARIAIAGARGDGEALRDGVKDAVRYLAAVHDVMTLEQSRFLLDLNAQLAEVQRAHPESLAKLTAYVVALCERSADATAHAEMTRFRRFIDLPSVQALVVMAAAGPAADKAPDAALKRLWQGLWLDPSVALTPGYLDRFLAACDKQKRPALAAAAARRVLAAPGSGALPAALATRLRALVPKVTAAPPAYAPGASWSVDWSERLVPVFFAGGEPVGAGGPFVALWTDGGGFQLCLVSADTGQTIREQLLTLAEGLGEAQQGRMRAVTWLALSRTQMVVSGDRWVLAMPFGFTGVTPTFEKGVLAGVEQTWQHFAGLSELGSVQVRARVGFTTWGGRGPWVWRLDPDKSLEVRDAWTGSVVLSKTEPAKTDLVGLPVMAGRWLVAGTGASDLAFYNLDGGCEVRYRFESGAASGQIAFDGHDRLWAPTDEGVLVFNVRPLRLEARITVPGGVESILHCGPRCVAARQFNGRLVVFDARTLARAFTLDYNVSDGALAIDALAVGEDLYLLEIEGAQAVASWVKVGGIIDWRQMSLNRVSLATGKSVEKIALVGNSYGLPGRLRLRGRTLFALAHHQDRSPPGYAWLLCGYDVVAHKQVLKMDIGVGVWRLPLRLFDPLLIARKDRIIMGTLANRILGLKPAEAPTGAK